MADLSLEDYVRTIEEPLLERRRPGGSEGDYARGCADVLRALYALDTHAALVIVYTYVGPSRKPVLLDGVMMLRVSEAVERSVIAI